MDIVSFGSDLVHSYTLGGPRVGRLIRKSVRGHISISSNRAIMHRSIGHRQHSNAFLFIYVSAMSSN